MVLGGKVIDDAELARLEPHSSLAIGEGVNLMQPEDDPSQYGNHSCDPNLWLLDEVTGVTRRPVAAGEELTVDYGTMTVVPWAMECHCGAPRPVVAARSRAMTGTAQTCRNATPGASRRSSTLGSKPLASRTISHRIRQPLTGPTEQIAPPSIALR